MKSRMSATDPLRIGLTKACSVHHVWGDIGKQGNATCSKCWLCNTSSHWMDKCQTFGALTVDERIKLAKENHICFACLKPAARNHGIENCRNHRKCTKKGQGKQCAHYHHSLLHKSIPVRINVASFSTTHEAILPIVTMRIHGQNGLQKSSNALLDSGTQLSLIKINSSSTGTQRKGHLDYSYQCRRRRENYQNQNLQGSSASADHTEKFQLRQLPFHVSAGTWHLYSLNQSPSFWV